MHPLHDYIAKQIAEKLNRRRVVVLYDPRQEFRPFFAEVRAAVLGGAGFPSIVNTMTIQGLRTSLVEYAGSFFEVRAAVEDLVRVDLPEPLLIYVPGIERDRKGSLLMELELAGECYEPQLRKLARIVLRQRYTDGIIDEVLKSPQVGYDDLARLAAQEPGGEQASLLRGIFQHERDSEALLSSWLADDRHDAEIEAKQATGELLKLLRSRLGLDLPADIPFGRIRASVLRCVLGGEFRADLRCEPPANVQAIPEPQSKDQLSFARDVARKLRSVHAEVYARLADQVEAELGLSAASLPAAALGSIDTFRFEERALLRHCGDLIAGGKYEEAVAVVSEREHSFWLDRDVGRKAQWEAVRLMAELGVLAARTRAALDPMSSDFAAWVAAYTAEQGWFRLDQAQRRLETWVAKIDEEPEAERALALVRRAYEETCARMAEGFSAALQKAQWSIASADAGTGTGSGVLTQTHVYSDVAAGRPRPLAYFLIDAMRFEMGVELAQQLPPTAELAVRPAIAALPTITPVGMAALLPGASASFAVAEQGGKLGARIDGTFLPDLTARKKHFAARVPGLVDLTLDELLGMQASKLAKRIEGAGLVVVRSQEIDKAGEDGFTFLARQVMDTVIGNVARAIRKLAAAGIEHFVVSADHGHHFSQEKEESMRISAPGGEQVELHRRCWIGRGGTTPSGCVRLSGAALGYDTDLDFVFPLGAGVFRAGGDLSFHHGGTSLQELLIPVLTIRMKAQKAGPPAPGPLEVASLPEAVTNRIFSVTLKPGGANLSLFTEGGMTVRPLLMSGGKQVGAAGMAVGAELDRATGCVKLLPGKPATVALLLSDDKCSAVRIVVQDAATDAVLFQSGDLPVRLM